MTSACSIPKKKENNPTHSMDTAQMRAYQLISFSFFCFFLYSCYYNLVIVSKSLLVCATPYACRVVHTGGTAFVAHLSLGVGESGPVAWCVCVCMIAIKKNTLHRDCIAPRPITWARA